MASPTDNLTHLQPRKPDHYRLPPVVQPQWRWTDLLGARGSLATEALREALCQRYGMRHCLLLDRARSGVFLLCKAFGLDGEWIMASVMHRPTAVVLANHCAGIAFADVDEDLCIAPTSAQRLINTKTSAILATHSYGKAADLKALRAIADRHRLPLIENAVHMASGYSVDGRPLGSWGDASLLSFNVDKPLGGILGGALLTNRDDVWDAVCQYQLGPPNAREMRDRIKATYTAYRWKPLFLKVPVGRKHRVAVDGVAEIESFGIDTYRNFTPRSIHPLQARVALACLQREQDIIRARVSNAQALNAGLGSSDHFALPVSTADRPHCYSYYPLRLRHGSRTELGEHLARCGIETKWRLAPLHSQEGLTDMRRDDLEPGNQAWAQHLLLPTGPSTSREKIEYLADSLSGWQPG